METTYRLGKRTDDPNEITSITLDQEWIPRKGEMVDLSVKVNDEIVSGSYRVFDVIYTVQAERTTATIILQ